MVNMLNFKKKNPRIRMSLNLGETEGTSICCL